MRRVLLDTNVILDVLLERQPHVTASADLWALVESGAAEGLIAAHAVTTIHYLVERQLGNAKAMRIVSAITKVFGIAAVDSTVIADALLLNFSDFEDGVTAAAAHASGCQWIATRDAHGFRGSRVQAVAPEIITAIIESA